MSVVVRVPIQLRELQDAIPALSDGVGRRAAEVVEHVMMGRTVVIEEQIGAIGDEVIVEETVLEAQVPS